MCVSVAAFQRVSFLNVLVFSFDIQSGVPHDRLEAETTKCSKECCIFFIEDVDTAWDYAADPAVLSDVFFIEDA